MEHSDKVRSGPGQKTHRCQKQEERCDGQTGGKSETRQIFNGNKTKKTITGLLTIETGMGPPAPLGYGYGETR